MISPHNRARQNYCIDANSCQWADFMNMSLCWKYCKGFVEEYKRVKNESLNEQAHTSPYLEIEK